MIKYLITMQFTKRENIIITGITYDQAKAIEELFSDLFPIDLEMSVIKKEE